VVEAVVPTTSSVHIASSTTVELEERMDSLESRTKIIEHVVDGVKADTREILFLLKSKQNL
jgi:hypothetical protein